MDVLEHDPDFLHKAQIADKVIGKGAAALIALGQAEAVYADVISENALPLFEDAGIRTTYATRAPYIINRAGTGQCPVETLCAPYTRPEDMLPRIKEFISNLK